MIQHNIDTLEKKIINIFDLSLKKPGFQQLFNIALHDFRANYNMNNHDREFDIIIYGEKRLSIGLLINEPFNIEIQTNRCTKNTINKKYHNELLSMILANGASNNSSNTNKVYSFVDFKNDSFTPCFLDNYCDKIMKVLGRNNIFELEKILYSNIDCNLKKGLLYLLCDKLADKSIKKIFFIPNLMQVSLIDKSGVNNLVVDSGFNRQKIVNYSLSKSYEKYLNANFNKKLSKIIDSKNFSLITDDPGCLGLCSDSEISSAILVNECVLDHGLKDYIKEIKKL